MAETVQVYSPNVLWHGGGTENGKTDPVFSVDLHTSGVLATAGIDENMPPKGCVRLWNVDAQDVMDQDDAKFKDNFLVEFADHQHAVNICRFSPCGLMLASASTRQIVVYTAKTKDAWKSVTTETIRDLERTFLRPSLDEIRDLAWSPDCTFLIAGSVDNKGEILRVSSRDSVLLNGHTSYVQGVAWDPLNAMVVTQSADRSVKAHQLKYRPGAMAKLAQRGHTVAKMHAGFDLAEGADAPELTAADFGIVEEIDPTASGAPASKPAAKSDKKNLYADSTVPSFFRRPCFSPDGLLLITPTGVNRPMANPNPNPNPNTDPAQGGAQRGHGQGASSSGSSGGSFCTHIYGRDHLSSPLLSLVGMEDPSVAVRCSPVLYEMVREPGETLPPAVIRGDYRTVFAVVTITAVYVYDTQHPYPLARLGGLHLACINDATWSGDGNTLIICSSDGYVTFIKFADGALGQPLAKELVPVSVQNVHRCLYNYTPPPIEVPVKKVKVAAAAATATAAAAAAAAATATETATATAATPVARAAATENEAEVESPVDLTESSPSEPSVAATSADISSPERIERALQVARQQQVTISTPLTASAESHRKRITPTLLHVANASPGNMNNASSSRSPGDVLNSLASTSAAVGTSQQQLPPGKKRRITPVLVTSALPLSETTMGSSGSSSSAQQVDATATSLEMEVIPVE